jgi:N-methylhydantoinase B
MGAMVKAVPERLPAGSGSVLTILYFGGTDPLTGQDYFTVDPGVGGQGARPTKDGVDTIQLDTVLGLNNPVEAIELQVPVRIVKWDLRMDSAGAGKYRGGLGLEKVWKVLHGPVSVTFRGERHYTRPWGLFGGLPGARQEAFIIRTTGEIEEIPSKVDVILNDGDELRLLTPGGAGYGDPLNREPEFVLDDVLNSKVSLEAAANDYGVIIDKESMTVNYEKTDKVRKERRRIRGPITWTYDRGPELGRE